MKQVLNELRNRATPPTEDDVRRLYSENVQWAKSVAGANALQSTRTEVHELLQIQHPAPGRDTVTDQDRIDSDLARAHDPYHHDAHHFIQKRHQGALWQEADALIKRALGGA